jgi:hypothetical protein
MNKSLDMQAWKIGAIAIVLAVVLPTLIEFGITSAQVATSVA